jgi:hypothetical protein
MAAWVATLLVVVALGLLVVFLPVVAAVFFVACVTFVAVAVGRSEGFWRGLKFFIKEMPFGW